MAWLQHLAIFAIGWGAGVTVWLATGHQAFSSFVSNVPRALELRRKNVLTSWLPLLKYLIVGLLLLTLGGILMRQLWNIWTEAYNLGLLAGSVTGVVHSINNSQESSTQVDFLLANRRYVDENKVSISTKGKGA